MYAFEGFLNKDMEVEGLNSSFSSVLQGDCSLVNYSKYHYNGHTLRLHLIDFQTHSSVHETVIQMSKGRMLELRLTNTKCFL